MVDLTRNKLYSGIRESLKAWLENRSMSTLLDRTYFGYTVTVRPLRDCIRQILMIPKWNYVLVPYFTGADIVYKLQITPTKSAIPCSELKYNWILLKKDTDKPEDTNGGIVKSPSKEHTAEINLGHFPFSNEYKLDLQVTVNNTTESKTVADIEIISRANVQLTLIWAILAFIFGIITYFIGKLN